MGKNLTPNPSPSGEGLHIRLPFWEVAMGRVLIYLAPLLGGAGGGERRVCSLDKSGKK